MKKRPRGEGESSQAEEDYKHYKQGQNSEQIQRFDKKTNLDSVKPKDKYLNQPDY